MATELEELLVQLRADNEEFKAALKSSQSDLAKATDAMAKAVDGFSKQSQGGFKLSQLAWASFIGDLASSLTQKAFGMVSDFFGSLLSEGVPAAMEAEKAAMELSNAFRLAGMDAETSTKAFVAFADELSNTTAFEDDAIVKTGAMIQAFARLDQEGLQRATAAAANFAAATGKDLGEVTQAVAKAMSGQISALSRLGIQLEDTGSKTKNIELALATLEGRFAGSAQAAVKTFSGALAQAKNSFGNFQESVGNLIVQNPVVIAGLTAVSKAFQDFGSAINNNAEFLKALISQGIIIAIDAFTLFIASLDQIYRAIGGVVTGLGTFVNALVDLPGAVSALAFGDDIDDVGKAFENTTTSAQAFKDVVSGDNTLTEIGTKAAEISNKMQTAFDRGPIDSAKKATDGLNNSLNNTTKELTAAQQAAVDFGESLAKKGMDPGQEFKDRSDALKAARESDLITEQDYLTRKAEMNEEQAAAEWESLHAWREAKKVDEETYAAAATQLAQDQELRRLQIRKEGIEREKQLEKERQQNISSSLGIISSLQGAHSKELVALGRTAATAQAIMDGQVAIQKAWAVGGPFGGALAVGVAAATAVQIAKIQGVQLAGGIDSVPGVGNRDTVPAMLTPGERVVPKNTNQDLKEFLSGNNEPKTVNNYVFNLSGILPSDGEQLVRFLNDTISRGSIPLLAGARA